MVAQKRKTAKKVLIGVGIALILAVIGVFSYLSDYYRADETALAVLETGTNIKVEAEFIVLESETPSDIGFIFYPGGKVEWKAYLPLLEQLQKKGINCILVKMPFHLAVFAPNKADEAYALLPNVKHWLIGGHSLGGAMASGYAAEHKDKIEAVLLLGAFRYGDVDPDIALTLYGSEDQVLDRKKIPDNINVEEIAGGNHAQFGNYGAQEGDGEARISAEEQQQQTVDKIVAFVFARISE